MRTKSVAVITLIAMVCTTLLAANADVNGTWNGEMHTREGGAFQVTLTLKADGDKVTGTVGIGNADDLQIENGKLSGDTVTFSLTRHGRDNQTVKINYTGKVEKDTMKLTSSREGSDRTQELTLTRSK